MERAERKDIMQYYEFNIRLICITLPIMLALVLVYISLLKDAKESNWFNGNIKKFKLIAVPILLIFVIFIGVVTCFSFASKNDETHIVEVLEVRESSGLGGSSRSYSMDVKEDEETYTISFHLFTPKKIEQKVEKLKQGDIIQVKYNRFLNVCYYIEN